MTRAMPFAMAGLFGLALIAFWPSYLAKPASATDALTHLHAGLMVVWFGLLIAQPLLIRAGYRAAHRALGRVSFVVVPLLVLVALAVVHLRAATMSDANFATEGHSFYLPLRSTVLFAVAYGLAMVHRGRMPLHARYMGCTAVALIDPVVARLIGFNLPPLPEDSWYPVIGFALSDLVLIVLWSRSALEGRRAYAVMLAWYVAFDLIGIAAWQSPLWLAAVGWYRALPLT